MVEAEKPEESRRKKQKQYYFHIESSDENMIFCYTESEFVVFLQKIPIVI